MVLFVNETGIPGQVYNGLIDIAGSTFLGLMIIILLLMAIAMLFKIPIEFTAIFILPLLLTFLAFESDFLGVTGVILIYLGILLGKNLFVNK